MTLPEIPQEAVQAAAEVLYRDYDSEYGADHLTWEAFTDQARKVRERGMERLGLVGKRVVVYLGVLTEYQGIEDLFLAWRRVTVAVPDAHLLVMGYPNVEHYRARATALAQVVCEHGDLERLPPEEDTGFLVHRPGEEPRIGA